MSKKRRRRRPAERPLAVASRGKGPRGEVPGGLTLPNLGRGAVRSGQRVGTALFGWLPLLALFALFSQVALLGLKPALAERGRLAAQESRVAEREVRLSDANDTHLRRLEAMADPVFQERVRRARRSQAFAEPPRPLDLPLSTDGEGR